MIIPYSVATMVRSAIDENERSRARDREVEERAKGHKIVFTDRNGQIVKEVIA